MRQLALILGISLTTTSVVSIHPSVAQTPLIPPPSNKPLELSLLTNPKGAVTTANTISQGNLTVPSLWLAKDNSQYRLLDNWIAYPASPTEPARVDLIINQQVWSTLDYLQRYDFVNRMGSTARTYKYNIRVFNYQQERLATYTCNFELSPPLCNVQMGGQNRFSLRRSS
jgi:hypothetical protein